VHALVCRPEGLVIRVGIGQGQLDERLLQGERRAQLVRGVGDEEALSLDEVLQSRQQVVEGVAQLLELIVRTAERQALVEVGGGSSSSANQLTVQNPALEHLSQVHATAGAPDILVGLAGILLIAAFGSAAATYLISRIQPAEALRSE